MTISPRTDSALKHTDTAERAVVPGADGATGATGATMLTQQWVTIASVLAGAIHLAVTREHLQEWWVFGAFFVIVGCFQLGFAVLLLQRRTWPVAMTGIVVNLGVVLVYVVSRTTGLPVETPEDTTSHQSSHAIEGVGPPDLAATGAELVVVCLLVTLLPPRLRRPTVNVLLVTGAGLWVLRLSGVLV